MGNLNIFLTTALFFTSAPALAQETASPGGEAAPESNELTPEAPNPDEMANQLNAQQSIKQTVTFTRRIDGKVVDQQEKTLEYSPNSVILESEAGKTALQELSDSFDEGLLTRKEAYEEARLDFIVADADRNGVMTSDEFVELVSTWRENDIVEPGAPNSNIARQKRYVALLEAIDPQGADVQLKTEAKQKFSFMAGVSEGLTQKDYIREYLLDFDSMDANGDTLLSGDELLNFRAANRGGALDL